MKALWLFFVPCMTLAQYWEGEETIDYDTIVDQLSAYENEEPTNTPKTNPYEVMKFHVGLGISNTYFIFKHPAGSSTGATHQGVNINLGIDLFSPKWIAEVGFTNFGSEEYLNSKVQLRQFDLRIGHIRDLSKVWNLKVLGGLSARRIELDYRQAGFAAETNEKFASPDGVAGVSLNALLSEKISLGAEITYRHSLVGDAPYTSGVDGILSIAGHL